MSFSQRAKKSISRDWDTFRSLSVKDKLWYIWEYYKFPIAVTAFVLICLVSLLVGVFSPEKVYLNNGLINLTGYSKTETAPLTTDFHAAHGLGKHDTVSASTFYLSFREDYSQEHYMALQSLQVLVAVGDLDLLFLSKTDFLDMESMGIYCDLTSILPETLWLTVKDRAIYVQDPETGESIPAALDVTACPAIQRCEFITDSVVVCVSPTTQRPEHCAAMLAYLFTR